MKKSRPTHTLFRLFGVGMLMVLFTPTITFAQEFMPLVRIPGLENATDLNDYINALYSLAISIAALIAVVKIVLAGAKYMLDDLITGKQQAKTDIWNALIGLLIIISAWLILNTINSDLTNPNILIDTVTVPTQPITESEQMCDQPEGCEAFSCLDYNNWPGYIIRDSDNDCIETCALNSGVIEFSSTEVNGIYPAVCTIPGNTCALRGGVSVGLGKCEFPDSYYVGIETSQCEDGFTCQAQACDPGRNGGLLFVTCESQCTSGFPQNIYDPISQACIVRTENTPGISYPVVVNANTDYKMTLSADDEAAGLNPSITITDQEAENGYVEVTDSAGASRYVRCTDITPSVCVTP